MYLDVATMDVNPVVVENLRRARGFYRLFYGDEAVKEHVAKALPRRMWRRRGVRCIPIRSYPLALSEVEAENYRKAQEYGFFDIFEVITPTYGVCQRGSWIAGRVNSTNWWAMVAQVDSF